MRVAAAAKDPLRVRVPLSLGLAEEDLRAVQTVGLRVQSTVTDER
jgi:hypothetical protein